MSNQKILELEATIKDTTSLSENTTEITDLKKSLNRAIARHDEESARTKNQIDELQKRLDNAGKYEDVFLIFFKEINIYLEKQLKDKDTIISTKALEISAMEERYVQYLEKAKLILRQMDPRNNNSITNQELQSLRKQIDEKDRKLKDLDVNSFLSFLFFFFNFYFIERI